MRHALLSFAIGVVFLLSPAAARASSIQFVATDHGGNVWQYDYYLDIASISAQDGFTVFFDYHDYSNLQVQPPATPGWDLLLEQPDVALQSDGIYDALALVDSPSFTGPFSVSFLWSGLGVPGPQKFDRYVLDAGGAPVVFESGVTTPRDAVVTPVPEPTTLLLLATGIAAARRFRRAPDRSAT